MYSSTPNLFYTQLTGHFLSSNNNLILPNTLISGTQDIEGVNGSLLINCTSSSGQLKYRQRKTYKSFQDVSQNHSNNEYQFETNGTGKTVTLFIKNVTLFRNWEYQCKHSVSEIAHLFSLNINSQSKKPNIINNNVSTTGRYICYNYCRFNSQTYSS